MHQGLLSKVHLFKQAAADSRFYGTGALNHPLVYQKYLPMPNAHDACYENADYIFRTLNKRFI